MAKKRASKKRTGAANVPAPGYRFVISNDNDGGVRFQFLRPDGTPLMVSARSEIPHDAKASKLITEIVRAIKAFEGPIIRE